MLRASIDGRPKKRSSVPAPAPPWNNEASKELRPASPPRINPWACKSSTTVASPDFPALPSANDKPADPVLEPPAAAPASATRSSRASSASSFPRPGEGQGGVHVDADAGAGADANVSQPPTTRSASTCSDSSSRHIFEAAVERASANLWARPFGADVVVLSNNLSFSIHRNIVQPESGWFQDHLPPPNEDGSPVRVFIGCPGESAAHCLRFAYTGTTEFFEYDENRPWNIDHLPRCVLAYAAAVDLRMSKLAARLLQSVERTSKKLGILVTTDRLYQPMDNEEWSHFSWHYRNALEMVYMQPLPNHLMMPMRLAIASVIDATLFWLAAQPVFNTMSWQHLYTTLMLDQAEYRRLTTQCNPSMSSPIASEAVLTKLFESNKTYKRAKWYNSPPMVSTDGSVDGDVSERERRGEAGYRRFSL